MTGRLLHLNGAPGVGKSTVAREPVAAANNRVIAAEGGDAVVLDRARRLRGVYASRPDVTMLDLVGDGVADSVSKVESDLADAAEGPA